MSPDDITIPQSNSTVSVRVFDILANSSKVPASILLDLVLPGREVLKPLPALSFLIEHASSKRRLMFDLGMRKDQDELARKTRELYVPARTPGSDPAFIYDVEKDTVEQLTKGGIALETIDAVIWRCDFST